MTSPTALGHEALTGAQIHVPWYHQSSDPGAVGAGKAWVDTTTGPPFTLNIRNAGDTAWQTVGFVSIAAEGTHAGRPAPSTANAGTLYYETDTLKIFLSTGAAWDEWVIGATASPHAMLSASHSDTNTTPSPIDGIGFIYKTSDNKWHAGFAQNVLEGLASNRPTADVAHTNMLYYETDTDSIFWCTGADWDPWPIDYGNLTNVPTTFAPTAHDHDGVTSGHGGILTNDAHDGYSEYAAIVTPTTPASTFGRFYFKTVSGATRLHYKSDDGQEFIIPDPTAGAPTAATYITGQAESGLSAELVLGASVIMRGLFSGQPTPTTTGVIWIETDTEKVMRWNGSSFDEIYGHPGAHDHDGTTAGHGGKLSGAVVDTFMELEEQGSNPSTPAANKARFYAKDVSGETRLFYISDSANVYELGTVGVGGSGAPSTADYITLSAQSDLSNEKILGTAVIMRGVTGSRPAAATAGLLYIDTTTGIIYRDNGATWDEITRAESAMRLNALGEKSHTSLSSVGADDHHNKAHDHTSGDGSGVLTNDEHDGYSLYTNIAAPSTPGSGKTLLYMSTGKHLHVKDDAGLDLDLSSGADPTTTAGDLIIRDASNIYNRLGIGSLGQRLVVRGGTPIPTWEYEYTSLDFIIDGGGTTIATGVKGDIPVGFDGTIVEAILLGDQTGSIVVEIQKCTYAQFDGGATHPVTGDKINSSTPPTISSATKSSDTTLTSWTTTITAGDILRFVVNSCSGLTRCTVSLRVRRS